MGHVLAVAQLLLSCCSAVAQILSHAPVKAHPCMDTTIRELHTNVLKDQVAESAMQNRRSQVCGTFPNASASPWHQPLLLGTTAERIPLASDNVTASLTQGKNKRWDIVQTTCHTYLLLSSLEGAHADCRRISVLEALSASRCTSAMRRAWDVQGANATCEGLKVQAQLTLSLRNTNNNHEATVYQCVSTR